MILTKEAARKIAYLLCAKHEAKQKAALKYFEDFVTTEYEKEIPVEIKKLFKKHSKWFNCLSYIQLNGHGFNYQSVSMTKHVPCIANKRYLELSTETAAQAKKLFNTWQDLHKSYKDLLLEVENALLTLKTFARITERFPEAKQYLPKAESRELIINFDNVRAKLKTA